MRDSYLDTMKGFCILSVIFIHTCFHSGESYVPLYLKNICLLFDVFIFFFLTGCLFNIKNDLNIFKQIYQFIKLFFLIVLGGGLVSGFISLNMIIQPLALSGAFIKNLEGLEWSYWFVPMYVVALLYLTIIVKYSNKLFSKILLFLIPIYYIYQYITGELLHISILGQNLQSILYYIWVMLLGYTLYSIKSPILNCCAIGFLMLGLLYFIYNTFFANDFLLQNYKSPISLPYILCSLVSLSLIILLRNKVRNNFLSKIGAKSIYFYISQGFGSSFLIHYHTYITIHTWYLKFIICFILNLVISILLGYLFYWTDKNLLAKINLLKYIRRI